MNMRIPSQLPLVLFAISVAVEAYVIPDGGKYPLPIVNSSFELTIEPLTGNKYHPPHPVPRSIEPDVFR